MRSYWGVEHGEEVRKGWGADLSRAASNASRKTKIREGLSARKADRAFQSELTSQGHAPNALKRFKAEQDFSNRSRNKARNFVERFKYDENTGTRRLASKHKTSPPRNRSLTQQDKRYLGLPGGEAGSGTRQGTSGTTGLVNYQFTGNKRVRKSLWGVEHGEEIGKIDTGRALALSAKFNKKGQGDLARRAYGVAARSERGPAGQRQLMQGRTLNDMESSARGGLGRAGRKRGKTYDDVAANIFDRSAAGRAGRTNPWR